jgi:hypothetical protein
VADDVAHVKSLGTEEEVGDELHTVRLAVVSFVWLIDMCMVGLTIARIQ